MRLPPPERADRKHDEVPVAEAGIDHRGAIRQELTVGEGPRQKQFPRLGSELDDDAGAEGIARGRSTLGAFTDLRGFFSSGPLVRLCVAPIAGIRLKR